MRTDAQRQEDVKKIRRLLSNNRESWQSIFGADNIHVDKHADRSDISMASKAAYEGRSVSTFPDDETMNECVCESIAAYAEMILKETEDEPDGTKKVLSIDIDSEEWKDSGINPVFKGIARTFDGKLKEMTTSDINIVYRSDSSKPLGFSIISAFPNVNCENAKPTGRDIAPIVKASKGYATASPLKRAWIDHALKPDSVLNMQYVKPRNSKVKEQIVTSFESSNGTLSHRVFIEDHAMLMQTFEMDDEGTHSIQGEYQQLSRIHGGTKYQRADLNIDVVREALSKEYPDIVGELETVEKSKEQRRQELRRLSNQRKNKSNIANIVHKIATAEKHDEDLSL